MGNLRVLLTFQAKSISIYADLKVFLKQFPPSITNNHWLSRYNLYYLHQNFIQFSYLLRLNQA
jgi:hypothetical protein